jgi:hypothetical protein
MRNFILFAGLLCFVIGCGPGGATVTGKVSLDDGSAAPRGSVILRGDAGTFQGAIGSDGTYTIENVADGDYQVAVVGVTDREETGGHDEQSGSHDEEDKGQDSEAAPKPPTSLIDAKYSDPTTSGITTSVPGGDYNITVDRASGAE